MTNHRFVLFDLDDTIVDFSGNMLAAGIEACAPLAARCGIEADALASGVPRDG